MKIFFVPGAYDGCYYYRGYLPAVYGNMRCIHDNWGRGLDTERVKQECDEADVLVFQRPNDDTRVELMKAYKQKGKFIVFENDDTYLPDKGVPLNMLGSDRARNIAIELSKNIERALKVADLVIASTHFLAQEYRQFTDVPVVVRDNTIDPLDEWKKKPNDTDKTRIGFVGSVASNGDYEHIKDTLRTLAESGKYTLVVLGHFRNHHGSVQKGYEQDDQFWQSLPNVEWHEFVHVTRYHKKLADMKLDMALIPRADNYFNRCKSNVKFLECSLQRIPVIAQGFTTGDSPYQGRKDKKYMQVVTKDEDWLKTVENTRENLEKYATLADKAHDYVLEHYNITKYAPKWRYIIEQYANRS